jgi:hypothetical protein
VLTFELRLKCDILSVSSDRHIAIRVTSGPGQLPCSVGGASIKSEELFVGITAALCAEVSCHNVAFDRRVPSLKA